ncbi:MAG: sulfurtransferase-like selenium metabolism protein YedF [Candidatus Adiutrix sp.]|nr:sulfurtransferase-like selenium metabolism protein YedF [Candidatus Adiutrix sp.]
MSRIFHLDLTGRPYPQPVLKIQALLEEGRRGPLTISLSDAMSAAAVSAILTAAGLAAQTYRREDHWLVLGREAGTPEILVWHGPGGWQAALDDQAETEDEAILDLGPALSPWRPEAEPRTFRAEQPVVLVGGQVMGAGEDDLGARLVTAFFDALAGLDPPPGFLAFYNTGVFLTTRDSAVVEALRDLAGRGATVMSSGLCLEYFGLKDRLKVGRIGNMYEIVKAQARAARIIRL